MQTQAELEKLIYPTGKFRAPESFDRQQADEYILALDRLPALLEGAVKSLSSQRLGHGYRPGSWNVKQIVHHVADSHLNFHIRLRLTLTEETPTVKPYDENAWARLVDYNADDISSSLDIIRGVHRRSVELLKSMKDKDFARSFYHPEHKKEFSLLWLLALYTWHGAHHAGQIKVALEHKF